MSMRLEVYITNKTIIQFEFSYGDGNVKYSKNVYSSDISIDDAKNIKYWIDFIKDNILINECLHLSFYRKTKSNGYDMKSDFESIVFDLDLSSYISEIASAIADLYIHDGEHTIIQIHFRYGRFKILE